MTFAWWHLLVAAVPMVPTFWALWHIWAHEFATPQQKAGWFAFVVLLPVIGGIIYLFTGRCKALGRVQR